MATPDDFAKIGLYVRPNKNQQNVKGCPSCAKLSKNTNDYSVSVNLSKGIFNCKKCLWSGKVGAPQVLYQKPITYKTPSKKGLSKLTPAGLKLFQDRKISEVVVATNKIVMNKQNTAVVFPYLRDGQIVNYKMRFLKEKRFIQAPDAEQIMFNYDRIKDAKEIVICEGEFDAMSWEMAGVPTHTSVSQGAPNVNDTNVDKKLQCVTNCYEAFEQAELVYIGVDNDANGRRLQEELIRRIGIEKVKIIDYSPHKDANDYLIAEGRDKLRSLLASAQEPKVEGVFTVNDRWEVMLDTFHNGKTRGTTTYFEDLDSHWTWRPQEVTIWTGYENEGKSTFLEQLCVIKAAYEGWKFAFFSPENTPIEDFYDNLIEMFIGKSADPFYQSNQMNLEEYQEAKAFVQQHFYVIYPEADFKLDTIFEKMKYLVRKYGINAAVIDPYNAIEHLQRSGEREELYITRFMGRLKRFAVDYNICMNLVAHQNTARINQSDQGRYYKPYKSNIKGGGVFAQRADNVNFVWRPNMAINFSDPEVIVGSQKIKKQKLVGIPGEMDNVIYSRKSNRYFVGDYNPLLEIDRVRTGYDTIIKENDLNKNRPAPEGTTDPQDDIIF